MVNMQTEEALINAEDGRSRLLEILAQANGGAGENTQNFVWELLLSQMGDMDPTTVDLLTRYLGQLQTEQADSSPPDDDVDTEFSNSASDLTTIQQSEERVRAFQHLRQTMGDMYRELESLRERNYALASALGACYLCWGEDLDCTTCDGTGQPGSSVPDRSFLAQLVVPAVRRLREREDEVERQPEKDHGNK